jgi:acetylornithine aminotransferase/acetylornithine/N-succinyldiaminopimelate aminotransferase
MPEMTMGVASQAERADALELPVYSRMPLVPVRGEGCWLIDENGDRWLDMYGGHAVALTGHSHPHVAEAIARQASELLFYSNGVHLQVRVEASELLLKHAPTAGSRVFYISTGCEANEVAMKLARKVTGRRKVIAFAGAFHGRTLGALSACGLEKYRRTAGPLLVGEPDYVFVPFADDCAVMEAVDGDTAAVICETIQSLGGLNMAPPSFYRGLRKVCDDAGAALILDEVQTGLGRTGTYFFADGVGVKPDMITLAKGIASGIPCGAVVIAPRWAEQVKPNDQGTTFGGGPVAMAAMKATLEVIEDEGLVENARRMGERLTRDLTAMVGMKGLKGVKGKGLLLGLEFDGPAKGVQAALLERRVICGGSDDPSVLRLLPPLTLGAREIESFINALGA